VNTFSFTARMSFNSVVIIDCLSEEETTGLHLYNDLRDLNIPAEEFHVSRTVVCSMDEIVDLLQEVERHCRSESDMRPILHFEAHGNKHGFSILGGDAPQSAEWKTLAPLLRSVNAATEYNLGVFLVTSQRMV